MGDSTRNAPPISVAGEPQVQLMAGKTSYANVASILAERGFKLTNAATGAEVNLMDSGIPAQMLALSVDYMQMIPGLPKDRQPDQEPFLKKARERTGLDDWQFNFTISEKYPRSVGVGRVFDDNGERRTSLLVTEDGQDVRVIWLDTRAGGKTASKKYMMRRSP